VEKWRDLRYELLAHPPYSPDLAPSEFHLFPHLKKFLRGTRFSTNDEVIIAVNKDFEKGCKWIGESLEKMY